MSGTAIAVSVKNKNLHQRLVMKQRFYIKIGIEVIALTIQQKEVDHEKKNHIFGNFVNHAGCRSCLFFP